MSDDACSWLCMTLLILLIAGLGYGSYKAGRWLERRALTGALITAIESSYWDGYADSTKRYEGSN